MNPLIGKFLSRTDKNSGMVVQGIVVYVLSSGDQFTKQQMKEWARIGPDHELYRSVRGPVSVDRVVLERPDNHYWIAPLHLFVGDR